DIKRRMDMFQIYAHDLKLDNSVDFAELARMTEGYSGGDIRDLFQSTQLSSSKLLHPWKRERSQLRPRRHHDGRLPVNNHRPPTKRFTRNPQAILRLGRIIQGKLGECKSELG